MLGRKEATEKLNRLLVDKVAKILLHQNDERLFIICHHIAPSPSSPSGVTRTLFEIPCTLSGTMGTNIAYRSTLLFSRTRRYFFDLTFSYYPAAQHFTGLDASFHKKEMMQAKYFFPLSLFVLSCVAYLQVRTERKKASVFE